MDVFYIHTDIYYINIHYSNVWGQKDFLMFMKEVCYAHQSCIFFKYTVKTVSIFLF